MSGHKKWSEIKHKADPVRVAELRREMERQTRAKGFEIPVPKRKDVLDGLPKPLPPQKP